MILYTCGQEKKAAALGHACGRAARALDRAGYRYELRKVDGYRLMPWTWLSRSRDRAEVKAMSGQEDVPILVLDDGEVVIGSGRIVDWAKAHPGERPGPEA